MEVDFDQEDSQNNANVSVDEGLDQELEIGERTVDYRTEVFVYF